MKAKSAALLLVTLLLSPLFAHDFYLMPKRFTVREGEVMSVGLHNGDAFPKSEVSPVLERVKDVRLISAAGSTDVTKLRVDGNTVQGELSIPKAESFVLVARTDPNVFSLPAKQFNAYLRAEGLRHVLTWRREHHLSSVAGRERYAKYAKALLTTGGSHLLHTQPVGSTLEIVPVCSPYDLKPGSVLSIQVLLRGKPAPDLQIESAWAGAKGITRSRVAGRTDKNGQIKVPLMLAGKWRIHTVAMEECPDRKVADWESSWASLTFELR